MVALNFNATQVAPNAALEAIPSGVYPVIINRTEDKPTKSGNGDSYIEFEMTVQGGEFNGRKLFDRLNLRNKNQQAVDIAYATLSAICHVCNRHQIQDTSQLHGIPFQAVVAKVGRDDRPGEFSNEVKGYKDAQGNDPGKGGAGAAPGAQPGWAGGQGGGMPGGQPAPNGYGGPQGGQPQYGGQPQGGFPPQGQQPQYGQAPQQGYAPPQNNGQAQAHQGQNPNQQPHQGEGHAVNQPAGGAQPPAWTGQPANGGQPPAQQGQAPNGGFPPNGQQPAQGQAPQGGAPQQGQQPFQPGTAPPWGGAPQQGA